MEWKILLVAAFAACATGQITIDDCPSGVRRDEYLRAWGSSCYYFVTDHAREWDVAEHECEAMDPSGHLVIIRDAATNEFLTDVLTTELNVTQVLFIGLTDRDQQKVWQWVDGSTPTYYNWEPGEPGILSNFEDCAVIDPRTGGMWDDYRCEDLLIFTGNRRYICEFPVPGAAPTEGTTHDQESA